MEYSRLSVAFCGAPQAGRSTLISGISRHTGSALPVEQMQGGARFRFAQVSEGDRFIELRGATGPTFDERAAIKYLLETCNVVCYVFASVAASGPAREEDRKLQLRHFETHCAIGRNLQKLWVDIPWIFVLNKADFGLDDPLLDEPPGLPDRRPLITDAVKGTGVGKVWEAIRTAS